PTRSTPAAHPHPEARSAAVPDRPCADHSHAVSRGHPDNPDFTYPCPLACPLRLEDSPRGLGRTLGKRVGGNPSRVRISYPPPLPQSEETAGQSAVSDSRRADTSRGGSQIWGPPRSRSVSVSVSVVPYADASTPAAPSSSSGS